MKILRIDHVQLAIPPGGEAAARRFYAGLLGIPEVAKPAALAGRGGAWFARGALKLHLGVDAEFRPARQAHPAFVARDLAALLVRLREAGCAVLDDAVGHTGRAFVDDPFGNRIELIARG